MRRFREFREVERSFDFKNRQEIEEVKPISQEALDKFDSLFEYESATPSTVDPETEEKNSPALDRFLRLMGADV